MYIVRTNINWKWNTDGTSKRGHFWRIFPSNFRENHKNNANLTIFELTEIRSKSYSNSYSIQFQIMVTFSINF